MANPSWLDWSNWEAGSGPGERDGISHSSFGVSESLNKGDGCWCPVCKKINKYSWLSDYNQNICSGIKMGWHNGI